MPKKNENGAGEWVDPDDAPPLTSEFFDRASYYKGDRLVRRGRPKLEAPKAQLTVRFDADLAQRLRASGPGWQTRLNEAVRQWLDRVP